MASFVIHNIAGERMLKLLEDNYGVSLTEKEKTDFIFGNLIVDSSKLNFQNVTGTSEQESKKNFRKMIQEEKKNTHFRNDDTDLCIQVPNLDKFETKYRHLLVKEMSALGYLFHLYTDKMFFEGLFKATFDTLDKNMMSTIYTSETKMIKVKKNNKIYTIDEFWNNDSKNSIYNDYTTMNKILLAYYGSNFNKEYLLSRVATFINPGIEEVDYNNITSIINKTASFINDSYNNENNYLNIFDEEDVKEFINNIAIDFINKYYELFKIISSRNIKKYKRTISNECN